MKARVDISAWSLALRRRRPQGNTVAKRAHAAIFTVDKDFDRYAKVLPIQLHAM